MPDFLHRDTVHDLPPPAEGRPARSADKKVKPSKTPKPKKPSRLFLEYYGALFMLLLAAFVTAGFTVLRPLIADFKLTNSRIAAAVQTLKDERGYLESLERSIAAAKSIPPDVLLRVDEALPREVGIPKLLQTMAELAERHKVRLNSVQFNQPKTPPGGEVQPSRALATAPLDISLTMRAPGYGATRAFLEGLERNLRVLDVQQITVTGNEQTGELTYSLQLRTYSLTQPIGQVTGQ